MECLGNKTPGRKKSGLLNSIPLTKRPYERIHVANLGLLVSSSRGIEYILVTIDSFTRFVVLEKTVKTMLVIRAVKVILMTYEVLVV